MEKVMHTMWPLGRTPRETGNHVKNGRKPLFSKSQSYNFSDSRNYDTQSCSDNAKCSDPSKSCLSVIHLCETFTENEDNTQWSPDSVTSSYSLGMSHSSLTTVTTSRQQKKIIQTDLSSRYSSTSEGVDDEEVDVLLPCEESPARQEIYSPKMTSVSVDFRNVPLAEQELYSPDWDQSFSDSLYDIVRENYEIFDPTEEYRLMDTSSIKDKHWPEESQELLSWEVSLPREHNSFFTLGSGSYSVPLAEPEFYSPDKDYSTPESMNDSSIKPVLNGSIDQSLRKVVPLYESNKRTCFLRSGVCEGSSRGALEVQYDLDDRSKSRSLSTQGALEGANRSLLHAGMMDVSSDYVSNLSFSLPSENHIRSMPNLFIVQSRHYQ